MPPLWPGHTFAPTVLIKSKAPAVNLGTLKGDAQEQLPRGRLVFPFTLFLDNQSHVAHGLVNSGSDQKIICAMRVKELVKEHYEYLVMQFGLASVPSPS